MDRLDQRVRSRGSRDDLNNNHKDDSHFLQQISQPFDKQSYQNGQQHLVNYQNSNEEQSDIKQGEGIFNELEQDEMYDLGINSDQKDDHEQQYEDYSNIHNQVEGMHRVFQNNEQLQQQIDQFNHNNDQNLQKQEWKRGGSFHSQTQENYRSNDYQQDNELSQYNIVKDNNSMENRVRQNSNQNYLQQQNLPQQIQNNQSSPCYDQEQDNHQILNEDQQQIFKRQSFGNNNEEEQQYKQQINQINNNNDCNLEDLIIDEGGYKIFDSKDQSYDYSQGSSPEKNLKESTNSGIQNYNSYQQKHRLIAKSNDTACIQEQQQQQQQIQQQIQDKPIHHHISQPIKYIPYQPTKHINQIEDTSSQGNFLNKEKRNTSIHESETNSSKNKIILNDTKINLHGQISDSKDYSDQSESDKKYEKIQEYLNQQQNKKGSFSMPKNQLDEQNQKDQVKEYQDKLREKDLILEQMREFTIQLQQALEQQQNSVIDLKKENVELITKIRDQQSHNNNNQQISEKQINNKEFKQDQNIQESQRVEGDEQLPEEYIEQIEMGFQEDNIHQQNNKQNQQIHQDNNSSQNQNQDPISEVKKRFYDMKNSSEIIQRNPIEDELYRQIDNLNEIIEKQRRDNMMLIEENRDIIQNSHRISQETKDLKYRLNNEIEILALQNKKLMVSHRLQQDSQDNSSKIHELNYKLEIANQEIEELNRINSTQLEDIKILLQEKDFLTAKVQELSYQSDQKGQETSRKLDQLKFDMAKEYEHKLNQKVQEIHYKSHQKIENYKNILLQYQQQYNLPPPPPAQTLNKQNNTISTPNLHSNISYNIPNNHQISSNSNYIKNNGQFNQTHNSQIQLQNENNNLLNGTYNDLNQQQNKNYQHQNSMNTWNSQGQQPYYKQTIARSNSEQDYNEKKVVWEICGILRVQSIENLPNIIADMKDMNKNLIKFSDCVTQMVIACHPKDYYGKNGQQPTLKQSWKWVKQIMEEYMNLKRDRREEFEQHICNMLEVNQKMDAIRVLGDKLVECRIANRVFKKISQILNLKQFNSIIEFEQAIEQIQKEDAASQNMYSPE